MLDSFEGAIAKSARAAGISANLAEKYAAEMVQKLPGKKKMDNKSLFFNRDFLKISF